MRIVGTLKHERDETAGTTLAGRRRRNRFVLPADSVRPFSTSAESARLKIRRDSREKERNLPSFSLSSARH